VRIVAHAESGTPDNFTAWLRSARNVEHVTLCIGGLSEPIPFEQVKGHRSTLRTLVLDPRQNLIDPSSVLKYRPGDLRDIVEQCASLQTLGLPLDLRNYQCHLRYTRSHQIKRIIPTCMLETLHLRGRDQSPQRSRVDAKHLARRFLLKQYSYASISKRLDTFIGIIHHHDPVVSNNYICPPRKTQARSHVKFNVKSIEDGSLYATLIKNSGLRLFVKPIEWTSLHLTLLDMEFHNLPPITQPVPTVGSSKATIDLSASAQALLAALNTLLETKSTECRIRSMLTVIPMLYPQHISFLGAFELHQYFGGRAYCIDCPVQAAWDVTPARSSYTTASESTSLRAKESVEGPIVEKIGGHNVRKQPVLVYVDLKTITVTRRAGYKPPRDDPPVRRLRKLLYRKVTPPNMVEDSFLAAVILALAQRPFYRAAPPSADKPLMSSPRSSSLREPMFQDTTVCILVVNDMEPPARCFVL
ncbi:hypothetical protein CABS02_15356, partial [Colletotrichum abscissum]